MNLVDKPLPELSIQEYRDAAKWNKHGEGTMREYLAKYRNDPLARAVLLYDGSELIGWALLTPIKYESQYAVSTYARRVSKVYAQFYVRTKYRKQGYGSLLMKEVLKHDPRPNVSPWNIRSGAFFRKFKKQVTIHKDERVWLR